MSLSIAQEDWNLSEYGTTPFAIWKESPKNTGFSIDTPLSDIPEEAQWIRCYTALENLIYVTSPVGGTNCNYLPRSYQPDGTNKRRIGKQTDDPGTLPGRNTLSRMSHHGSPPE